ILAMVSAPSYDPNVLVSGKQRNRAFAKMYQDSSLPLFNRALQAMYPPGSTFKLLGALIGQHEGVIHRGSVFPCAHGFPPMGGKPKCHSHAAVNLPGSVATSCNSYYSYVFREITDQKKFPRYADGYSHWR